MHACNRSTGEMENLEFLAIQSSRIVKPYPPRDPISNNNNNDDDSSDDVENNQGRDPTWTSGLLMHGHAHTCADNHTHTLTTNID